MRHAVFSLVVAAGISASPAMATQFVLNGDFSDLNPGGLGKQDAGSGSSKTGATDWTNDYYTGSSVGYNFIMSNATSGSGGVALWDHANWVADPDSSIPVADQTRNSWDGMTASGLGNFLAMDGAYQTAAVSQTIDGLTVGDIYTFSFNYGFAQQAASDFKKFNGDTVQTVTVTLGGQTITLPDSAGYTLDGHQFSGWSTYTETVKATDTSETVSFLAYGNKPVPPFALVSDVSLIGGVPEPTAWAMMALGFAGLGFAGFRSTRRKADFAV